MTSRHLLDPFPVLTQPVTAPSQDETQRQVGSAPTQVDGQSGSSVKSACVLGCAYAM